MEKAYMVSLVKVAVEELRLQYRAGIVKTFPYQKINLQKLAESYLKLQLMIVVT